MKIQVLGSGCATCKKLYEITQQAVSEMNLQTQVEYITGDEGIFKIIELGAVSSPVLTVDDRIVMTGFTPEIETIKAKINQALETK